METAVDIGTLITHSPGIKAGRPRIAGTGVTVRRIVVWYKLGLTPEEIGERIGHVTVAQVYAALAYYHARAAYTGRTRCRFPGGRRKVGVGICVLPER